MLIEGEEFRSICDINPQRSEDGDIVKYSPSSKYDNIKNLPLHTYGAGPFCRFRIPTENSLGVYAVANQHQEILYIGKCTGRTSTLGKRFNYGYGSIQPRNCYKGGQSTNCRVNHLILKAVEDGDRLSLFFCNTNDGEAASVLESTLLRLLEQNERRLPWNLNIP